MLLHLQPHPNRQITHMLITTLSHVTYFATRLLSESSTAVRACSNQRTLSSISMLHLLHCSFEMLMFHQTFRNAFGHVGDMCSIHPRSRQVEALRQSPVNAVAWSIDGGTVLSDRPAPFIYRKQNRKKRETRYGLRPTSDGLQPNSDMFIFALEML